MRPRFRLCALGIALSLAAGARAEAVQYADDSVAIGSGTKGYADVACPRPRVSKALSSGVATTPGHNLSYLNAMSIDDASRGSANLAFGEVNAVAPVTMTVFVACTRAPVTLVDTREELVPGPMGARARARCPRGTRLAGGATHTEGSYGEAELIASRPVDGGDADNIPDDAWEGRAKNLLGTSDPDLTFAVYADCLSGRAADDLDYGFDEITMTNDGQVETVTERCEGTRDIVAGGFHFNPPSEGMNVQSSHYRTRERHGIPRDEWVSVFDSFSNADQDVRTYAICMA